MENKQTFLAQKSHFNSVEFNIIFNNVIVYRKKCGIYIEHQDVYI